MSGLLVVGAGGHGKVAADTAAETGHWSRISFLDDKFPELRRVQDWDVIGQCLDAGTFLRDYPYLLVAIGDPDRRLGLIRYYAELGFSIPVIVHPMAYVSKSASLGSGTVVYAQAAVNAGTFMGEGCIINTGATVDHDCDLASGVHVAPGGHLSGHVKVGRGSWVGVGVSVKQGVKIGAHAVVGAGAAVIEEVPDQAIVVGVPAKRIEQD